MGGRRKSEGMDRVRRLKENVHIQLEGGMIVKRDVKDKKSATE